MPAPDVKPASPYPALAAALPRIPGGSGVYLFKEAGGRVLYVGKAVNLKHRLASYLKTPDRHDPKTALMLRKMAQVDVILTATGREALILERNLIKEHRPRFNVMLRDDKNYLCLRLDLKETFPALRFVRRFNPDGARYFGPYASGGMARETLKVMQQAFGAQRRNATGYRIEIEGGPTVVFLSSSLVESPDLRLLDELAEEGDTDVVLAAVDGESTEGLIWASRELEPETMLLYRREDPWALGRGRHSVPVRRYIDALEEDAEGIEVRHLRDEESWSPKPARPVAAEDKSKNLKVPA